MSFTRKKATVITGAGISAESGLSTYRVTDGIWNHWDQLAVASFKGWKKDREKVLDYWNQRKRVVEKAKPNRAHGALVALESAYDGVMVISGVWKQAEGVAYPVG